MIRAIIEKASLKARLAFWWKITQLQAMRRFRSKTFLLGLLAVTGALAVALWLLLWRDGDGGSGILQTKRRPATAPPGQSALLTALKPEEKSPPEFGTPEFNKTILERCAKWMESRGRDSASLIAMWDLAGDESLLLEAAEKFPNDPRVCAAMIAHLDQKGEDALPWAERLIKNETHNPAGHYWKATLLANAGKPEEALEALRRGTEVKGTPDQHLRERLVTAREAVLAGGGSVKEAAQAALLGPFSKKGQPVLAGKITSALKTAISEAKSSGDEGRLVAAAGLSAAAAEHMRHTDAPAVIDYLVGQGLLMMALNELPPETEYGIGGRTAGERLAEMNEERIQTRALMQSLSRRGEYMEELSDGQISEYTDRVILRGEREAMQWMNELLNASAAGAEGGP